MASSEGGTEGGPNGAGPIRNHKSDDRDRKGPIAAPVKSACTFCRSRKSRCDGNVPCSACVGRGRVDDCIYTVSRRGGKPKPKMDPTQDLQSHLNKLFALTDMPYAFRRPGGLSGPSSHGPVTGLEPAANFSPTNVPQQPPPQPNMYAMPNHFSSFSEPNQDMMMDALQSFLPGGFAPYVLDTPSQQQQQPSYQSDYQQQFQPIPSPHMTQHQPQMLSHQLQQGSMSPHVLQPSQYSQSLSPQNRQGLATSSPQQSTIPWGSPDNSLAAYHASSVPGVSPSATSNTSRRQSIETLIDPSRMFTPPSTGTEPATSGASGVRLLLVDYYRYLYRFIPVLPPPKHIDILASYFKPDSSFIYALQCILPLLRDEIQPIGAFHKLAGNGINFGSEEKKAALRERTLSFERKANAGVERLLEEADRDKSGEKVLEVVQTLSVLVVYEYGSGRPIKARLKADQALGLAMSQDLHKLTRKSASAPVNAPYHSFSYVSGSGPSSSVEARDMFEMRKRCWWSVWSLVLWAAYNTGRIPTIRADDPRVKSEVPVASDPDVWTSNIGSLQALLLVQDRVLALAHFAQPNAVNPEYQPHRQEPSTSPKETLSPETSPFAFGRLGVQRAASVTSDDVPATFSTLPTNASRQEILDSMLEIDTFLQNQIRNVETREAPDSPMPTEVPQTGNLGHVDQELEDSLRMGAAVQLYTSSLTLHIGQAFQGASLFERKLCFLNSTNDTQDGQALAVCQQPMDQLAQDDFLDMAQFGIGNPDDQGWTASSTSASGDTTAPSLTQQDLYARGPFLPRLSLQRCVHASRKLLDIARRRHGQSVNPNPFNCCSFVLISFVLLMQALAVHGGFAGGNDEGGDADMAENELEMDGQYANDSLQSLIKHSAVDAGSNDSLDGSSVLATDAVSSGASTSVDAVKLAKLRDIWGRVREAHETLTDLGKHWEAVVPMADEVSLCLETSQLLLSNY